MKVIHTCMYVPPCMHVHVHVYIQCICTLCMTCIYMYMYMYVLHWYNTAAGLTDGSSLNTVQAAGPLDIVRSLVETALVGLCEEHVLSREVYMYMYMYYTMYIVYIYTCTYTCTCTLHCTSCEWINLCL